MKSADERVRAVLRDVLWGAQLETNDLGKIDLRSLELDRIDLENLQVGLEDEFEVAVHLDDLERCGTGQELLKLVMA